jgi:hypothetical protein
MMGFVFYIEITGRNISLIGYYIVVARDFFEAIDSVISEFAEDADASRVSDIYELMDVIGEYASDQGSDHMDYEAWCGLKPIKNEAYSFWCNERNPYKIMDVFKNVFSNSDEVIRKNKSMDFDQCVIDSLIKSPGEIFRFDGRDDLQEILNKLPDKELYIKLLRAKKAIKFS